MSTEKNDIAGVSDETLRELLAARLSPMAPVPTGMRPAGRLRTTPSCILFDVYGTLLISGTGDISITRESANAPEKLQALLDSFGIRTAPGKLLAAFFNEIQRAHQAARDKGADWPEVRIERIWSRVLGIRDVARSQRFALEFEIMANPVWPMPGFEKLLAACRKAGIPLGIISNAQFYTPLILQWFLEANLADLGFRKDLLLYSYEIGCAKPSSRLFELAARRLGKRGISPGHVLYIGNDEKKDVLPARHAGFQTALFAGDTRSLRRAGDSIQSDLVITELDQLLEYI
jgi:putative hydrolase of the HAD superfamily